MTPNPVAAKRQRRRPKPGLRTSLRRHCHSEQTSNPKTCNQNFSRGQKRTQQDDCRNQQYSVIALTNSAAGIVERYAYSAYGEPLFATGAGVVLTESAKENRYTYTGREWDEGLGLYHFRARMYDAGSGRFCGRDPIGYHPGANRYSYVSGMPLERLDPSGLWDFPFPGVGGADIDFDLPDFWTPFWKTCGLVACHACFGPIALDAEEEVKRRGIKDRDNIGGGNAFLHCLIACRTHQSCPSCDLAWNLREDYELDPPGIGERQDLCNNARGQKFHQGDCWTRCMHDWENGYLCCLNPDGSSIVPCPAPPTVNDDPYTPVLPHQLPEAERQIRERICRSEAMEVLATEGPDAAERYYNACVNRN